MKNQSTPSFPKSLGWILCRLVVINAAILLTAIAIGFGQFMFDNTGDGAFRFPFMLFTLTLTLANLIYLLGTIYEIVYSKLWAKKIEIKKLERQFFKAAFVMIAIVNVTGILLFIIGRIK